MTINDLSNDLQNDFNQELTRFRRHFGGLDALKLSIMLCSRCRSLTSVITWVIMGRKTPVKRQGRKLKKKKFETRGI